MDRHHTGRLRKRDNLLTGEVGRGRAWNRIILQQESLALHKSLILSGSTSGFWPRVRARALRAPVFLGYMYLKLGLNKEKSIHTLPLQSPHLLSLLF